MKKGSLVLSNSATPGLPIFLELDACIHDGWLHFQDIKSLTYNYLYLFFKEIRQDLIGQGNGSIFINLKTDILKDYRTPIPTSSIISSFENTIAPIFEEIKLYSIEINELTTLRDLILPKLISGKLDVAEVME
jgi:type I restriction enzyme S subunit